MQNAVRFLETLGQGVVIGQNSYADLVEANLVEGAERDALSNRDLAALSDVLCVGTSYFCMVATPDGSETERPLDEPDEGRDDGKDAEEEPERRESPA